MENKEDGGPAFPGKMTYKGAMSTAQSRAIPYPDECNFSQEGMSLRDWFAGMFVSAGKVLPEENNKIIAPKDIARQAYMLADAMLEERKKE